jgi:hypothetical protein
VTPTAEGAHAKSNPTHGGRRPPGLGLPDDHHREVSRTTSHLQGLGLLSQVATLVPGMALIPISLTVLGHQAPGGLDTGHGVEQRDVALARSGHPGQSRESLVQTPKEQQQKDGASSAGNGSASASDLSPGRRPDTACANYTRTWGVHCPG